MSTTISKDHSEDQWPTSCIAPVSIDRVPWHFKFIDNSTFALVVRSLAPTPLTIHLPMKACPLVALIEIEFQRELRLLSQRNETQSLEQTYLCHVRAAFLKHPNKYAVLPSGAPTKCPSALFKWASRTFNGFRHTGIAKKQYEEAMNKHKKTPYSQNVCDLGNIFNHASCLRANGALFYKIGHTSFAYTLAEWQLTFMSMLER